MRSHALVFSLLGMSKATTVRAAGAIRRSLAPRRCVRFVATFSLIAAIWGMATFPVAAVVEVPDPELCGYPNADHLTSGELDGQVGNEHVWRDMTSLLGKIVIQSEANPFNCWPYTTSSGDFAVQGTFDVDGVAGGELIVNNSMPVGGRGQLDIINHRTHLSMSVTFQSAHTIFHSEIDGQPGEELAGVFVQPTWTSAFVKVFRARTGTETNYSIEARSDSYTPTVSFVNKDGVAGNEIVVQYSGPSGSYGYLICDRLTRSAYYTGTIPPTSCPSTTPPTPPPPPPPPAQTWPMNCGGTSHEIAFQANTAALWTIGKSNLGSTGLGMMPGTSPSIACLANGGYQVAFQANTGRLITIGTAGAKDWGFAMKAGTSPSITGLKSGGFQVAFQGSDGSLWTVGSAGNKNWKLGMMAGTSPSIAGLAGGGFQVAFQANTGTLWTAGTSGINSWGLGMRAGTSPSVAGLKAGGYLVAFQANTGVLWTAGTPGVSNWNLGMMAGTSPAITWLSNGGYQIAFQANTSHLWTVGSLGATNWNLGMKAGSSPGITGLKAGGFQAVFQANTGNLWWAGSLGAGNLNLGMYGATSPAIARY